MRRLWISLLVALAAALLSACERGPDENRLLSDLQDKLNQSFGPDLLEITWLRRSGSAPDGAAAGAESAIVYFDAELSVTREYDFASWDSPGIAALAGLMGATEQGLTALKGDAGDRIAGFQLHGSQSYIKEGEGWTLTNLGPSERSEGAPIDNFSPPSRAVTLIEQIEAALHAAEGDALSIEKDIVTYELEDAWTNIRRRIDRSRSVYGFAGGPMNGEYWRLGRAYARYAAAKGLRVANLATSGSVENVNLLRRGEADFALVQSDIAIAAYVGADIFSILGPMEDLRALASLYPEPVHVITMAESGIAKFGDLAGRRLELGPVGSGTRRNALTILKAHGLKPDDFESLGQRSLDEALTALADGEADAAFLTIGSPAQAVRDFLAQNDARLVGLVAEAVENVAADTPSLVPFTIPSFSYFGQAERIPTLAATAVLATRRTLPDGEAAALLAAIFGEIDFIRYGSLQGTRVARSHARDAVGIPFHAAAEAFYAGELQNGSVNN